MGLFLQSSGPKARGKCVNVSVPPRKVCWGTKEGMVPPVQEGAPEADDAGTESSLKAHRWASTKQPVLSWRALRRATARRAASEEAGLERPPSHAGACCRPPEANPRGTGASKDLDLVPMSE